MITLYKKLKEITIPILVIHDKDDLEACKSSSSIRSFKNGKLLTEGLGHRKILGDSEVIQRTVQFKR
jgi:hypothetical protein